MGTWEDSAARMRGEVVSSPTTRRGRGVLRTGRGTNPRSASPAEGLAPNASTSGLGGTGAALSRVPVEFPAWRFMVRTDGKHRTPVKHEEIPVDVLIDFPNADEVKRGKGEADSKEGEVDGQQKESRDV